MVGTIKHIIVIESLFVEDKKTGEELYNDKIKRQVDYLQSDALKMTHKFYLIGNKNAFLELLKFYEINSKYMQGGILIHLEIHGSQKLDGLILSDNSLVTWEELSDSFRGININTCNKLYITMATCFGRYLYKGVDPRKKSPYSGYISASQDVSVGEVMEDFGILFDDLIQNGNLVKAYLELESKGSNFYYKDRRRTFEENYKAFYEKMKNDSILKIDILRDAQQQAEKAGEPIADESMSKLIFDKALDDIYKLHKKAFDFDCE